jgi:hypothetical protein
MPLYPVKGHIPSNAKSSLRTVIDSEGSAVVGWMDDGDDASSPASSLIVTAVECESPLQVPTERDCSVDISKVEIVTWERNVFMYSIKLLLRLEIAKI